jgi:hypothetical protein
MKAKQEPTAEQLTALRQYAAEKGRTWKRELSIDWMHARAQVRGQLSPELQQVRNQLGPTWLLKFRLDA